MALLHKNPMSNTNRKYGLGIYHFTIPAPITCHPTEICFKACYRSGFHRSTWRRYWANLHDSFEPDFVGAIVKQIRNKNVKHVRIHPLGDFYSQEYLEKWLEIIESCPDTRFLAYTRNHEMMIGKIPENLAIYFSLDDSTIHVNPGIDRTAKMFEPPVVRKYYEHMEPVDLGDSTRRFVCSARCEHCKACWSGKIDVAFPTRQSRKTYHKYHLPYNLNKDGNHTYKKGVAHADKI